MILVRWKMGQYLLNGSYTDGHTILCVVASLIARHENFATPWVNGYKPQVATCRAHWQVCLQVCLFIICACLFCKYVQTAVPSSMPESICCEIWIACFCECLNTFWQQPLLTLGHLHRTMKLKVHKDFVGCAKPDQTMADALAGSLIDIITLDLVRAKLISLM